MHKSELAALDRKITVELAPTHEVPDDRKGVNQDENDGTENKQKQSRQSQPDVKADTVVSMLMSTHQTFRRVISHRWRQSHNPVIPCRQVCRVFRLVIPKFDYTLIDISGFNAWSVYCFYMSCIKFT